MEYEGARIKVERLAQRFGEPYKLLAYHAALPLVLTPELLNYLRNKFLGDKVPWVTEVDLLLSDLCREVAYEQFAMDSDTRAYLLIEADEKLGRRHMQDVARLLIRYVQNLSGSASAAELHQLQAQRWAAMVYLDEQREIAVQQIAESFLRSMTPVAPGAGRLGSSLIDESELARLSQITQMLAPQLEASWELVEYAAEVSRILAARGGEAKASVASSKPARVADVTLPAPAMLLGETAPEADQQALEVQQHMQALRESEERFRSAFDNATIGMGVVALNGSWLQVNRSLCDIVGYDERELLASNIRLLTHREDIDVLEEMLRRFAAGSISSHQAELRLYKKTGQEVWVYLGMSLVQDSEARPLHLIFQIQDITDRKRAEEQLLHDAFHDSLTGLPNRALFMDHVKMAIQRSRRSGGRLFAVLFLDLDRFKIINDSLGHMLGDQLLIGIAHRLETCLRPGDTVARLGGDEFIILQEDLASTEDAIDVARRVQEAVTQPFNIGGHEVWTTISIGIALSDMGYERAEDLLRDANTAMYRAKMEGKKRYVVFDKAMHDRAMELLQLETDLRRAITRKEFFLYYQPIVSLEMGRVHSFEALVRWRHPERGIVPPSDFIPVAEETGLIIPLGQWVLNEACRQMREWQRQGLADESVTISVNLSGRQFSHPDLIDQVSAALRESGLRPAYLKLEITESMVMENVDTAIDMLMQLRNLGVGLSIDDFGTGYSSLSYLHRFPIDTLKIDRSFVTQMTDNSENAEIVRTIVTLARSLDMEVVAEGVETANQLRQLGDLGCDYGQGYLFSRPVLAADAEKFIKHIYLPSPAPKQAQSRIEAVAEQEGREIAQKILERLYEAWEHHTHISLNSVEEEGGWDRGVFRTVVEQLEKQQGLIKSRGSSYTFEITPSGVLYVEENKVVPKDKVEGHGKIRRHILSFLADLYDREGGRAHAHWEKIAEGALVQDNLSILQDLSLLSNLGYVKATSVSTFRVTEEGLRHYRGTDYE